MGRLGDPSDLLNRLSRYVSYDTFFRGRYHFMDSLTALFSPSHTQRAKLKYCALSISSNNCSVPGWPSAFTSDRSESNCFLYGITLKIPSSLRFAIRVRDRKSVV